jgi:hypothetical protein
VLTTFFSKKIPWNWKNPFFDAGLSTRCWPSLLTGDLFL